jgi:RimJ/RimL family protein N-acetyltransferase
MLKGQRVLLRPMTQEDTARQHEFNQDLELYGLDSTYPRVSPLERAQAFYEGRTQEDETIAPFAIEAEGKYTDLVDMSILREEWQSKEKG